MKSNFELNKISEFLNNKITILLLNSYAGSYLAFDKL